MRGRPEYSAAGGHERALGASEEVRVQTSERNTEQRNGREC